MADNKVYIYLFILLISMVAVSAVCTTPDITADDNNISGNVTLCTGSWNLNDTDDDGAFRFRITEGTLDSPIVFDCNNSIIYGNNGASSIGLAGNYIDYIEIKNCHFINYSTGVYLRNQMQAWVHDVNITNSILYGLNMYIVNTSRINDVLIINVSAGSGIIINGNDVTGGISTRDNLIANTTVYNASDNGIVGQYADRTILDNVTLKYSGSGILYSLMNNTIVRNSHIEQNGRSSSLAYKNAYFQSTTNFTEIYNNVIANSGSAAGGNCLDVSGYYNHVYNNIIANCTHCGYNNCNARNVAVGGYNNFTYNNLTGAQIYFCDDIGSTISYNIIRNIGWNDVATSFGISMDGTGQNFTTINTIVAYNTIINVSGDCIHDYARNTTYMGNTLTQCNKSEVRVSNFWENFSSVNNPTFLNNIFTNGFARYVRDNVGAFNLTVNETSNINHTMQVPANTGLDYNIYLNFSGRKIFSQNNDTITATLEIPNIVYWKNGTIIGYNYTTLTQRVLASQQLVIIYSAGPGIGTPGITAVASSAINYSGATITWTTNVTSNSTVLFGNTTALGNITTDATNTLSHSIILSGLQSNKTHYYNVTSCTIEGCTTSSQYNFTTLENPYNTTSMPNILNQAVGGINTNSAIITWDTNVTANSTVNYGTTYALGILIEDATEVISRAITLNTLIHNTTYYYNITSCTIVGCQTKGPYEFQTQAQRPNVAGWDLLMNGQIVMAAFTALDTPFQGWLIFIFWVVVSIVIISKTNSYELTTILGIIFLIVFITVPWFGPAQIAAAILFLAFQLGMALFKMAAKEKSV